MLNPAVSTTALATSPARPGVSQRRLGRSPTSVLCCKPPDSGEEKPGKGFGKPRNNKQSNGANPQDALAKSLAEISKREGRVAKTNNMILGSENTEEKWREIDQQVNAYPGVRTFTAIGTGGSDFADSMIELVVSQVGPVHEEAITYKCSEQGKYTSVRIGPVVVSSADQVVAIYAAMREDERLKWWM